jgi:hypothetical protein
MFSMKSWNSQECFTQVLSQNNLRVKTVESLFRQKKRCFCRFVLPSFNTNCVLRLNRQKRKRGKKSLRLLLYLVTLLFRIQSVVFFFFSSLRMRTMVYHCFFSFHSHESFSLTCSLMWTQIKTNLLESF